MKTFDFEQGTMPWNAIRAGVLTASEASSLFTDKMSPKKLDGEGPRTYLCRKLCERWRGGPLPGFSSQATEFGKLKESGAVSEFEFKYDIPVKKVGFIMSDDGLCGCSPDGLLDGSGLEVKCLEDPNHVKHLLAGVLPEDFTPQVMFSMFVTGFQSWHFFSYCADFPPLLVAVKRDEKIMEAIQDQVDDFQLRLGTAWKCLVGLNGGKEPAVNPYRQAVLEGRATEPEPTKEEARLDDKPDLPQL